MIRPRLLGHDGREHGERAVCQRRRAERVLRAVEVDVVAGTQLCQATLPGAVAERRRRADRQFVNLNPGGGAASRMPISISASCFAIAASSSSDDAW